MADRLQETAASAPGAAAAGDDGQPALLAAIGRIQDPWRGPSRRWIDALGAFVPGRPGSAGA